MTQRRQTRQRQLVLDTVKERLDHPTADMLYLDVRKKDEKISRGTVYRNLNVLADEGEILHIKVPGVDRFDWRTDYHYHVLCTGCGKVSDLDEKYNKALDRRIGKESGYQIARHRTIFEGLCPECQRKNEQSSKKSTQ